MAEVGTFELPSFVTCSSCGSHGDPKLLLEAGLLVPVPGDTHFQYHCKTCTKGSPQVKYTKKSWRDIAIVVLYNMSLTSTRGSLFTLKAIKEFVQCRQGVFGVIPEEVGNWGDLLCELKSNPDFFLCSAGSWGLIKCATEDVMELESAQVEIKIAAASVTAPIRKEMYKTKDHRFFEWCHQCKQKHDHVFRCTQDCNKKYCSKCLQRHYGEKESDIDPQTWVCVYCRQLCCCAFCRKKKAKLTNTKFESRRGKKRNLRHHSRGFKKRRTESTESSASRDTEDSEDFVENEEEEEFIRESPVHTSGFNSPTAQLRSSAPALIQKYRRVSLRDLIEAGLLFEGDEVHFRKSNEYSGILLATGQICCGDHICQSLSTFAKFAASELGTKWSRQNGWRLVYCRSKSLYDLRKEYIESHNDGDSPLELEDEEEEEDDDDAVESKTTPTLHRRFLVSNSIPLSPKRRAYSFDLGDCGDFVSVSREKIPVARSFDWLKYSLPHTPEYLHAAPMFSTLPALDTEFAADASDINIQDAVFFPVSTNEDGSNATS